MVVCVRQGFSRDVKFLPFVLFVQIKAFKKTGINFKCVAEDSNSN